MSPRFLGITRCHLDVTWKSLLGCPGPEMMRPLQPPGDLPPRNPHPLYPSPVEMAVTVYLLRQYQMFTVQVAYFQVLIRFQKKAHFN